MVTSRNWEISPAVDRRSRLSELIRYPFAHRGLHGPAAVENTTSAFAAAIAAAHGIELDVQESLDGRACVFHDSELDRLTEATGPLLAHTLSDLAAVRLRGSQERIAPLERVLDLVSGQVPLLVELKTARRSPARLCAAVLSALAEYQGPVAVMSYHPGVGHWFWQRAPHILRGLVVRESGPGAIKNVIARRLAVGWARPDLLAYNIEDLPSTFATRMRALDIAILAWTCRSEPDVARAGPYADQIIYETGADG